MTNGITHLEVLEKEVMKKLNADESKDLIDPVRQAFDKMKRIKDPDVSLKEFAGLDVVKKEINEIITFLRDPSLFEEMGARPPRGVLIVGEPGTGKTSLAMAIAAEAKVPIVELDGLELEGGSWVGQGASNVRELFKTARQLAPLIIFMDDFDFFAGVRGDSGDTRKQDHESLINQLLVELDGFETQDGVVLLATSSRPGSIDEALRRPGRMDRTILLPMPNKVERELILKKAAEGIMDRDLIELVDWKEMARKTEGMSPQQLIVVPRGLETSFVTWKHTDAEEMFNLFWLLTTVNKITPEWVANTMWMKNLKSGLKDWMGLRVTKEEVDAAVECIDVFSESRPGLEMRSPGYPWTREFKFPHAVWAAGRGLLGVLLPNFDVVQQIWLNRWSWEGIGFTRFSKQMEGGYQETGTFTRAYYEKKLVLCFGSSVASYMLLPYGESNDLSKYELQEAREIATAMVLEFGWGPDDSQAIYASRDEDITMSMGNGVEYELNAKAAKIFTAAADKAACMLEKNKQVLEALVEHLLQFDAISKKDIARILKENGAVFEENPFMLFPHNNDGVVQVSTNGTGRSIRQLSASNIS